MQPLVRPVLDWFASNARALPWRAPGTSAYGVLVSEIMLQQTPVARVVPAYDAWLARWPTIAALAAASPGDAVRQWDRLGYPRRALRLHAAATACVDRHGATVPDEYAALRALPGVGAYTAAAVCAFAFGSRHAVLDVNVRRVLSRAVTGEAQPPASIRKSEQALAESLLPADRSAPLWSAAVMELGALVCTARSPACDRCPISRSCAWLANGRPGSTEPAPRTQAFAGTDRQVRGRLLAVLREHPESVRPGRLDCDAVWPDAVQRGRALESLLHDGLAVRTTGGYALPR